MVEDDNERIGELIRRARKKRRLKQQQLADLVGLAQMAISDLEQGKRALKVSELSAFAKALDVPITYLIP
jgi:transcriptional regulator with XRE-family HTH domain